jgi:NADH-quinone oxidoreductase subunit K
LCIVAIGYFGLTLNKKNIIFFLVYLEVIYNGIMLSFVITGYRIYDYNSMSYFLVILAVVASEAVVGLVLAVLYHRVAKTINLQNLNSLKG